MTDIFGVGYENKDVEKYREFSDPKLKKESDKLISDLMKDSNINKKELEKKVINFLDKYKGDTKRFPEIKQKLFLKLQKEIGSQRAALNSPDGTADTDTADKISKLYVLANIVQKTVLIQDNLKLKDALNDCYKLPEEKPAKRPQESAASQPPPETPPAPPPSASDATTAAAPAASAADKELEEVKKTLLGILQGKGIDTSKVTIDLKKLDNGLFEVDISGPNPNAEDKKTTHFKGVIDKSGFIVFEYADNKDSKISTFDDFYRINTNNFLENNFVPPLKPEQKDEIVTLLKNNNCLLITSAINPKDSKFYTAFYSIDLKGPAYFAIDPDKNGKISFADFKSNLEKLVVFIKSKSQSAPAAPSSSGQTTSTAATTASDATTAAAPPASADKELEEVKKNLIARLKNSTNLDISKLNIVLRKLEDNGLFEVDINAPKDGKFLNPEGAIDKDGKLIIDYTGIIRDPKNYQEMLKKNNLIQHQDEKSKEVHFHDEATYNNNEDKKISTFDTFYRITMNNFLENNFVPPLKPEQKDEIVRLLKDNNCMLGNGTPDNSQLEFLIYSVKLKSSVPLRINCDQNGKISFVDFKSKLEEIFATIKTASQPAPDAPPAAPPEYKAEPEQPTAPPPAMPGEQGAAPAAGQVSGTAVPAPAAEVTAAKIGNITPSLEGDRAALKELGLSFKNDGSDPNNYTIESKCNLVDYMWAVTGGIGNLDLEILKKLDYESSKKLDKPINIAKATKIIIIGEPTLTERIYSAAICVYNNDKTIDVIRIKGEPKAAKTPASPSSAAPGASSAAPVEQAAGTAQNKPEIMANKEIVYNNNKDLLAKAGITFTERANAPDSVYVTLNSSVTDNFNVSLASVNNKSEEKDAKFKSLNDRLTGGFRIAAHHETKKIEVIEENGIIKLYSYDTADDGKQTIGILKFEPKKSAAPAGQAAGSTATAEGWGAEYRKTTPSSASTEAAAAASADAAELNAVKKKFVNNYTRYLEDHDVSANDIVLKKLDNGVFEVDLGTNGANNGKFLNPELAIDAEGNVIINYMSYFDKDVSKYMDSKLLEENNLVERKEDGKFHFYDKTTNKEISSFDVFSKINANRELNSKHFNARLQPEEKQDIANLLQQKGYTLTGIGDMYKSFGGAVAAEVRALDYLDISIYDSKEKKMKTFEIKCTNGKISPEDLKNCINNPIEYGTHKKAGQTSAAPAGEADKTSAAPAADKKVSAKGDSPISSDKMKATTITPCITTPLSKDKNTIFCPTFQLAWDALCDAFGGKLTLSDNPKTAAELNASKGSVKEDRDISLKSFLAMAGSKKEGIIAKINAQLKEKFGHNVPLLKEEMLANPSDILAYAYLLKDLKFKNKFNNLENPISFCNGKTETPVEAFGIGKFDIENEDQRQVMDQAKILYYGNGNSIVQLETTSPDDELILAKIKPGETLEETYSKMNELIAKGEGAQWGNGDSLQIPKIDLNISHNYKDLEGKNIEGQGYYIEKAQQDVKFSLNEEGARLESQAVILASRGMGGPKKIIFDQPFLVCLRKKGSKQPYLLIWVNDPEILKQIQK